jgi:hypothetical protein
MVRNLEVCAVNTKEAIIACVDFVPVLKYDIKLMSVDVAQIQNKHKLTMYGSSKAITYTIQ